jgi:hypothetical protein
VVVILAVAGIGLLSLLPPLRATNQVPQARVTASSNFARQYGEVELDGTASWDPEHDELFYYWEVVSPPDARVLFSQNKSRDAGKTRAAFLTPGIVKIQLRVYDGTNFSSAAYVVVNVH